MRIPVTSQLAMLVLSLAAWSAWGPEPLRMSAPVAHAVQSVYSSSPWASLTTAEVPVVEVRTAERRVTFAVENAFGPTWVDLCGTKARVVGVGDDESVGMASFSFPDGLPTGCSAHAERSDGDYVAESASVRLGAQILGESVTLRLPDHRMGGIGVVLEQRDGGLYIDEVSPRGAAAEAGVRPGDRVLMAGHYQNPTMEEARSVLIGPEGTTAHLGIARDVRRGEGYERLDFGLERRSHVE